MDIITKFLKFLLGVCAKELNVREDYVKRSMQGKLNSATQKQTESYLRPLFRKLRKRNLPANIKESITDIIKFMLQRENVMANDAIFRWSLEMPLGPLVSLWWASMPELVGKRFFPSTWHMF